MRKSILICKFSVMKNICVLRDLLVLASLFFISVFAQASDDNLTNLNYTLGNYMPYESPKVEYSKPPKGYKPFYISHYGRHGSRFHYSSYDYEKMYKLFQKADSAMALTAQGMLVLDRFKKMYYEYYDRAGDLTPMGVAQHKSIAHNMMKNYPEVFEKGALVDAKSSTSTRCVMSMDAFCQQIKEENPNVVVRNESSKRLMYYLASPKHASRDIERRQKDSTWRAEFGELHTKYVHPTRMVNQLFRDSAYVAKNIDTIAFMRDFYTLKCSLASFPTDINFDDVWLPEELVGNWIVQNAWWYGSYGPCPMTKNESRFFETDLLKKIIEEAEVAMQKGDVQVNLRFGHDTALMPLTTLMGLSGCDAKVMNLDTLRYVWNDYKIIPMAGNVQFIFYRSKKNDDVLVRVMLNERDVTFPIESDVAPYYEWGKMKKYFNDVLAEQK